MSFDTPFGDAVPVYAQRFGSWQINISRTAFDRPTLARIYDDKAPAWHGTLQRLGFDTAYTDLMRAALTDHDFAIADHPLQVLDAGIGTGGMSHALSTILPTPMHLHGVDISANMLAQAEHRLCGQCASITLRNASVDALPFADDTFDLTMVSHVLEHLGDPQSALAELYRVLKPGGLFIACITRPSPLGRLIQAMWRTRPGDPDSVNRAFQAGGFHAMRRVDFPKGTAARWLSNGFIAQKPAA